MKTAGVLGGLGPAATVDFMARVIARTAVAREQDHVRLIVDCNPHVPDRNEAAASGGTAPGAVLAAMARGLETAGAAFVVMPCNAAHAYAADIRAAIAVPFIDMIEAVADAAVVRIGGAGRVALLAADACLAAGLYQRAFADRGIAVALPDEASQARFMTLLYHIKTGEMDEPMRIAMQALALRVGEGCDALVAGCTEVPLALAAADVPIPLISCSDILAERTILAAGATLRA